MASWCVVGGARGDCTLTNTGRLPLPEAGHRTYQGYPTGLYPNYANNPPPGHLAAGLSIATNLIQPRDANDNVDPDSGKIVLLSIGMSNTSQEWASKGEENFRALANADPSKNPRVLIVDGAQGGQAATDWTNFPHRTWSNVIQRLANAGATTNQVQVIWMKHARRGPVASGAFPAHARALQEDLEKILRLARSQYPNLKIAYVSSRTRSYEDRANFLNPEPFAYEGGFATKWMIEKQINGDPELNFDPARGAVVAPYLLWGPYLWADGTVGRSDGLVWLCTDLEDDFTHPSATGGVPKVARQLLAFFKTDPTAAAWFLRPGVIGQPPTCAPGADVTNGFAPLTVHFSANASDPDGALRDYQWNFDDGTTAWNANPTKLFKTPGLYLVRLTVTDADGNTARGSVAVTVRTTFEQWRADKFTAAEQADEAISGPAANPDFDPFPNLLEYVMGLEPKSADPAATVSATVGAGLFRLEFPRFKFAGDAALVAEASADLSVWQPVPDHVLRNEGTVERVEVTESVSGESARYFRLRGRR